MTPSGNIDDVRTEVVALKARLDSRDDGPWYKKPSVVISLLALIFSFGTTVFSAYNSYQDEIRANRLDVRTILQRLSKLPLENYELLQKYKGQGQAEALSGMINQENILLATQAVQLLHRFPNSFTSTEFYAVGYALSQSNIMGEVPKLYQRAMDLATTSNDYLVAARAYGGYQYGRGEYTEGKRLYNEALSVWNKFPERNTFIVNSSDVITLINWSGSDFMVGNKVEARERLVDARKRWAVIAPISGPMIDTLKNQIDYIARYVDAP